MDCCELLRGVIVSSFELRRILKSDNTWNEFCEDWRSQCEGLGEDFSEYASEPLSVLETIIDSDDPTTWVVGVWDGKHFFGACLVNCALLPKTIGKTLRVRQVVVSPLLDYGEVDDTVYADTLIALASGVVKLSESDLAAQHIKFHLRSPHDMMFFRAFGNALDKPGVFEAVEMRGAWLYITKR
jgi:hypothetical protein